MSRKPITELAGGQSPRQRVWAHIRQQAGGFGLAAITPDDVPKATARDYLKGLAAAGYLTAADALPGKETIYFLARDNGIEAPRVRRDGSAVTQGGGNEAIWGAIGVLETFDAQTLADLSGAALGTVKTYCIYLERAGYLTVAVRGKGKGNGGVASVFRTVKSRISGPRAPMITRLRVVYDPNLHRVVWGEGADEAVEGMDHA